MVSIFIGHCQVDMQLDFISRENEKRFPSELGRSILPWD